MAITLNGTTGISGIDGTAAAPALQGADSDTGIVFGVDTTSISTAGTERVSVGSDGDVELSNSKLGIGTDPSADLDLNGNYAANEVAVTVDANSVATLDCSLGNYFTVTVTANTFFAFTNVPTSRSYGFAVKITHTSGTISWPSSVKFPADASAPSLTTGRTHLFGFITDTVTPRKFRASALVDYANI